MVDAIRGTTVMLEALDGEISCEVKPGAQSGDIITIKSRGLGHLRGSGRGDVNIAIQVTTPTKLSSKEKAAIEQFAQLRKPVKPQLTAHGQGIFSKLRDRIFG
jgi:molecular chaperone DnaJ